MQILWGLETWYGVMNSVMRGVFTFVAQIYDFMLSLVENTAQYGFTDFTKNMYVLAGVFMLFRVMIGMIQMLINPDQATDANVGVGKLATRVVVCIILLITFYPTGFVMKPETGLMDRIQNAIIGADGLIQNTLVSPTGNFTSTSTAKPKKLKTCYFANLTHYQARPSGAKPVVVATPTVNSTKYKIEFYDKKCNTCKGVGSNPNLFVKVVTTSEKYDGKKIHFGPLNNLDTSGVSAKKVGNCKNWYIESSASKERALGHSATKKPASSYFGGFNSLGDMVKATNDDKANNSEVYEGNNLADASKLVIPGIEHEEATCFATNALSAFQNCINEDDERCVASKSVQFGVACNKSYPSTAIGEDIEDLINNDDMQLSYIPGIFAGVAILIFIVLLCIDVIIRNLKLMLLGMLAPIPIVCYADPKDQIFMRWLKMYFSVYLDLFFKLFAINIAILLITNTNFDKVTPLQYFFLIIAILMFAKAVPDIISKIFGIDMNGSLKSIGGMLKAGAGFAAGAAIGGVAGLSSGAGAFSATKGQGLGNRFLAGAHGLGSGAAGALRGAGAGSKGNIFGGARSIAGKNANRRNQYLSGLRPTDLLAAATVGRVGMGYAARTDRRMTKAKEKQENLKKFTGFKGDIESAAEDSKFMKSMRQAVASGRANFKEDELQAFRDRWSEYQIASALHGENSAEAQGMKSQLEIDTRGMAPIGVEGGKQSAIMSTMTDANALLAGNHEISGVAGASSVSSFSDLADANKVIKAEVTRLGNEIYAQTTANAKYNISNAASNSLDNKK